MAWYRNISDLEPTYVQLWFTRHYSPGDRSEVSGIYKCESCGYECVSVIGEQLPPQGSHPHGPYHAPIVWRLAVQAKHWNDQMRP